MKVSKYSMRAYGWASFTVRTVLTFVFFLPLAAHPDLPKGLSIQDASEEEARGILGEIYQIISEGDIEVDHQQLSALWEKGGYDDSGVISNPSVRIKLARICIKLDLRQYLECRRYALEFASSRNWVVRSGAVDALSDSGDAESIEIIYRIAKTPHKLVSLRAVRALGYLSRNGYEKKLSLDYLISLGNSNIEIAEVNEEVSRQIELSRAQGAITEREAGFSARNSSYSDEDISRISNMAQNGDPSSQHLLGAIYLSGAGGIVDAEKSAKYFTMAVSQKYPAAFFSLGVLYLSGRGVDRDEDYAISLFEEGARLGDKNSIEYLERFVR